MRAMRRPNPRRLTVAFCLATLGMWMSHPNTAMTQDDGGGLSPVAVERSIRRGIDYLKGLQNDRGGWDEFPGYVGGTSALCTLALVNAGEPIDGPAVQKALRHLRGITPDDVYVVALQTLVFCDVGAASDLAAIRRNVRWLVDLQTSDGLWPYGPGQGGGDESNAQFAILALGAAEDRGIEVPERTFRRAAEYWRSNQQPGGGWSYRRRSRASGSMTCAGVASMIITASHIDGGAASIAGDDVRCCGTADDDEVVRRGLEWLGQRFTTANNPGGDIRSQFYYLYALERVGRLSGQRFIGGHDWYRAGADRLITLQDDFSGFWDGSNSFEPKLVATSFALLFLAKGKRRVAAGQLKYPGSWQRHRGNLRSLVRHVENHWEQKLTWQIIDGQRASLADLLQSPVIIISGRETPSLDDRVVETLGEYINQGGTVMFDADGGPGCGGSNAFDTAVAEYCRRWFDGKVPQRLPTSHPVWTAGRKIDPAGLPEGQWIYGVDACCRTSVFYVPQSLSCRWSLGDVLFRRPDGISESAVAEIQTAIDIGSNVLSYATGRRLQDKLNDRLVLDDTPPPTIDRGAVRIATLSIDAGGDGVGGAVANAVRMIDASLGLPVATPLEPSGNPSDVGFDDAALADVTVLWIHGRGEYQFEASERESLRRFIENGGVMIASAICGDAAFAESFRNEFSRIIPGGGLAPISDDHPVLRVPGGYDLSNVAIRRPGDAGEVAEKKGPPVLETYQTETGLTAVIFSPLDISCALESPNSVQCPGYATEDAAKIVANAVLLTLIQ